MTDHMVGQVHELDESANTLEIENLARFAVDEHNKKENAMLEYKRLVDAKQQVVAGLMYYLTVEVEHGGSRKHYEAKVWEKSWENFKELQHFNHIGDAPDA